MVGEMMLFTGNASPAVAKKMAHYLRQPIASSVVSRFSDGEIRVEIEANVRGRDVFLVQSTCAPANDNLMELLIMAEACRRSSAGRVTAVMPYFGYARQDRKVQPRAPITAKLVAELIQTAGVERVLTMDLHAGQIQGFFDVPVDNLYALPVLYQYLKENLVTADPTETVIVSPDAGGVERARSYARRLGAGLAVLDKRRSAPNEAEVHHIVGDVKDRVAIVVDDMVDTAGTLTKGCSALKAAGARAIYGLSTHPVLSGPAVSRVQESDFDKLIVTDTIPLSEQARRCAKIEVLSVAPLFAEAIRAIHFNDSISRLFLPHDEA
ncbi:MAG: ribose-phosphate pyrophosphokinase [Alphaproteobacteria bacterium]|nr:ribose-phosphate pyrophosphokinase [Alphaproteobacteria bacterium]MCB9696521.1 ribose-phosphate pyrophosphokinase [Alphaproteobacteria bacterium]